MPNVEGMEFLLQLEAELSGATEMVRALRDVDAASGRTDRALMKTEKHVSGLSHALHEGKEWWREFTAAATGSFTGLLAGESVFEMLKEGIKLLIEVGKEALMAGAQAQRTEGVFKNLLGEKPGGEVLEYIQALSRQLEFTEDVAKGFALSLHRAGFEGMDFKRALAAVGDIASRFEDKMGGAQNAISLLSTVKLGGGIRKGQLRGIGVDVKDFYADLAKQTGIGVKEVQAAIDSGKIKEDTLIEAIYSHIVKPGHKLGDEAEAQSHLLGAKLEKLKAAPEQLMETVKDTKGFENFTASIDHLLNALDPESPEGKRISAALGGVFDKLGSMIKDIDIVKWSHDVVSGIESIGTAAKALLATLEALATSLKGLGVAYDLLAGRDIRGNKSLDKGAVGTFYDEGGNMVMSPNWIGHKFKRLGQAIGIGTAEGVKDSTPAAVDAVDDMMSHVNETGASTLEVKSPSRVFRYLGEMSAAGYAKGFEDSMPEVEAAVQMLEPAPARASGSMGARVTIGDINVTVEGGGAGGEDLGAEVARSIRTEIQRYFETSLAAGGAG